MNMASSPNNVYTFNNPRMQVFSLPNPFTTHIFKYYSAKAYSNLMMTCKLFYGQKRIVVVDLVLSDASFINTRFDNELCDFYLKKLEDNKMMLWITKFLTANFGNANISTPKDTSNLLKNVYRFDGFRVLLEKQ